MTFSTLLKLVYFILATKNNNFYKSQNEKHFLNLPQFLK